ncbi:hypothetical protein ACQJBY_073369 [Aegilops geniculata]
MDGSSSSKRKAEAQREGESSTKRLNVTVGMEHLDCSICSKPLRPPILQCSVGHFICSYCCTYQVDSKCHLCSEETTFERCFGMEHVVESVTVACSNEMYGCGETLAVSLCLQPGLHVLQCTRNSYFFLLSMASEPFGHVISVVCVEPNRRKSKFTCNLSYDCITTGCCGSTSCHIRSSSLSDGLPTVYDLILPKGKVPDDVNGIMLRATINHQTLSHSRSCFRGKGPTSALQQRPDTCDEDDDDDIPKSHRRSHPAKEEEVEEEDENDEDNEEEELEEEEEEEDERPLIVRRSHLAEEEDERPLSLRRSHPAVQLRPNAYHDDGQVEEDEEDARPVSVSRPRVRGTAPARVVLQSDTDDEDDFPIALRSARLQGTPPAPAVQEKHYFDTSNEDDLPIAFRPFIRGTTYTPAVQRRGVF